MLFLEISETEIDYCFINLIMTPPPKEATKEVKESGVAASGDGSKNTVIDFSKLLVHTKIYLRLSFTKQILSTLFKYKSSLIFVHTTDTSFKYFNHWSH
jgi:hypothetical protein